MQRDESSVASHHLEHDDAVMTLRRRVKLVDRLERGVNGGVESERRNRAADVVVYRFWDADDSHPALAQLVRNAHRSVTADRDQRIDAQLARVLDQLVGPVLL